VLARLFGYSPSQIGKMVGKIVLMDKMRTREQV
jgi:hypothetical protein